MCLWLTIELDVDEARSDEGSSAVDHKVRYDLFVEEMGFGVDDDGAVGPELVPQELVVPQHEAVVVLRDGEATGQCQIGPWNLSENSRSTLLLLLAPLLLLAAQLLLLRGLRGEDDVLSLRLKTALDPLLPEESSDLLLRALLESGPVLGLEDERRRAEALLPGHERHFDWRFGFRFESSDGDRRVPGCRVRLSVCVWDYGRGESANECGSFVLVIGHPYHANFINSVN